MSEATFADVVLRQFLLGTVDADQRQRIESLFLTDTAFNERLLAIEQDLIDNYLEGSLTQVELESFRTKYVATRSQRQKLSVSMSVKEWADSQLQPAPTLMMPNARPWLRPFVAVPVAAVLLVATVLVVVWISNKVERQRRLTQEQELARLNSPTALAQVPAGMPALTLSPINTRTLDSPEEIDTGAAQLIELRLLWIRGEHYPEYRAVLKSINGSEAFTIQGLTADRDNPNLIRLRLPTNLLTTGPLRITLTGPTPDALTEEYTVRTVTR